MIGLSVKILNMFRFNMEAIARCKMSADSDHW